MIDDYAFWKMLHLLSAAVLLGTGAGIAFFAWFGYRRAMAGGDIGGLRTVLDLTVIADAVFTLPAVVAQPLTGIVMMRLVGWPLDSPWALTAYTLYAFTGACWLPVVAIQIALAREARRSGSTQALPAVFHRRFKAWFALGVSAFASVLALYALMVIKPAFLPMYP